MKFTKGLFSIITATILLPGCQLMSDVFETDAWSGVIIIVAIMIVLIFIIKLFR